MRTPETEAAYADERERRGDSSECALCAAEAIMEFKEWKIIPNRFPYDLIARTHHMAVPKRHASDADLNDAEKKEFVSLKQTYIEEHYEFLMEPVRRMKTIPAHAHVHLLIAK